MNPSSTRTDCKEDLSHLKKMSKLIDNGYLADCTFIVGPDDDKAETILGHKMLFIMESPVFEKMLIGNYVEARDSKIRIIDTNPHVFKIFRLMIYNKCVTDLAKFTPEDIILLYRLCDKYMASSISKLCVEFMKNFDFIKSITVASDFITVFEIAFEIEDKTLLNSIKQAIANGLEIKHINKRLNTLSVDAFYEYIQLLSVNPKTENLAATLFSAINSYFINNNFEQILKKKDDTNNTGANNTTNIKVLLEKLLGLINFEKFGLIEFQEGPGKSKLLSTEQKYYIISSLLKKYYCKHRIPRSNCRNAECEGITIVPYIALYPS